MSIQRLKTSAVTPLNSQSNTRFTNPKAQLNKQNSKSIRRCRDLENWIRHFHIIASHPKEETQSRLCKIDKQSRPATRWIQTDTIMIISRNGTKNNISGFAKIRISKDCLLIGFTCTLFNLRNKRLKRLFVANIYLTLTPKSLVRKDRN